MVYRRPPAAAPAAGIHTGTVTRVVGATVFVTIPAVALGFEYGPARRPVGAAPAVGATVAVGFLEGRQDDVVILAVLA